MKSWFMFINASHGFFLIDTGYILSDISQDTIFQQSRQPKIENLFFY